MTLDTNILLTGDAEHPVDHRAAFEEVNRILGIPSEAEGRLTTEKVEEVWDYQVRSIRNQIGQGFPAIVDSESRADGSSFNWGHNVGEWACDEDCSSWRHVETYDVNISIDTGYGYRGPEGENCTSLHARVILAMKVWADEHGLTMKWVNEYTGEVNTGLSGLERFIGNGDQAQAWFHNAVLPMIDEMIDDHASE